MIEKFFTTEQVANILQVHPFTILKFIKEGKLKGIKLGRVYRIQESDVKHFLEIRMEGHAPKKKTQPEKPALESTQIPSQVSNDHSETPSSTQHSESPAYKLPADGKDKEEGPPEKDHYYII